MRLETVKRIESITAILLSLIVLFLLVARAKHAGGLWRDECGVVQLARMPSFVDITRNFQHEAFPLLFPATIRTWTNLFGTSDTALRGFGLAVGILFIGVAWFNSHVTGSGVPLLSLVLVGLNTTFLTWGTSIRGYGIGSVLIMLAFGLTAKVLFKPTPIGITATALVCLASVQSLLHNTALLLVIVLSAAAVCLVRHNLKRAIVICAIGMLCLISFLPYVEPYSSARTWKIVVELPPALSLLWNQLNSAFGSPWPEMAWLWHIFFVMLIGGAVWRLYITRPYKLAPDWDLLLFGILVSIASVAAYYAFFRILNYIPQAWYYLALISVLGATLELLAARLSNIEPVRLGRVTFAILALIGLPFAVWPRITERPTNIDIVAHKLEESAAPTDLIVVSPWPFGIPFNWYYHGATPWVTVPQINEHRIHRYDLLKAKMTSSDPIADLRDVISRALRSGNRVWFVGGISVPRGSAAPLSLSPAPDSKFGWNNLAYVESWIEQLGVFVRAHAAAAQSVPVSAGGPVNNFENVPLVVAQGWHD
jgi:hypothetical protein